MSLDEVKLFFKRIEIEKKERLTEIQSLATLILNGIGNIFGDDKGSKIINIIEMYPSLFEEDKKKIEQEKIRKELELNKANMIAFMNRINNSRKEG